MPSTRPGRRARSALTGSATSTPRGWPRPWRPGTPQAIQNCCSLLERQDERELLPLCAQRQVAYLAFSPLAGGWLTGKYRRGEPFPAGSRMTQRPGPYRGSVTARTFDALARLQAMASGRGISMAGLALAWLLADERVTQIVIGPGRPSISRPSPRRSRIRSRRGSAPRWNDGRLMRLFILSHDDVLAALQPEACADAMAAVLAEHARGETHLPLRSVMMPPGAAGFMGLMPCWRGQHQDRAAAFALKAICIMPGNPARGLDAHQGLVALFDGESGIPTAILDASAVTAVRTAAVTAVATRLLARPDARRLAILGAGTQARAHLRALENVRDFEQVCVYAPTQAHARALAEQAGAARGKCASPPAPRRRSATPTSSWR